MDCTDVCSGEVYMEKEVIACDAKHELRASSSRVARCWRWQLCCYPALLCRITTQPRSTTYAAYLLVTSAIATPRAHELRSAMLARRDALH